MLHPSDDVKGPKNILNFGYVSFWLLLNCVLTTLDSCFFSIGDFILLSTRFTLITQFALVKVQSQFLLKALVRVSNHSN